MNYFCILIRIVLHDTIFYDTVIIMGRERPGMMKSARSGVHELAMWLRSDIVKSAMPSCCDSLYIRRFKGGGESDLWDHCQNLTL
jgi:hypothetical protein